MTADRASDVTASAPDPATGMTVVELARMLDLLTDKVARFRVSDLRLVYCNRAWAAQFGASPEQLVGTPIDALLNEEERVGLRSQLERLGPRAPFLMDSEIRPASRAPGRWVEWADRYLPLETGAEILAVGRDITERHLAEQRLAASEVLFRTMAEAATDLVWRLTVTPTPELSYVSPSLETLTGWHIGDLTGSLSHARTVLDERGNAVLDGAVEGGTPPERFDIRMRRADGTWLTLEMQVVRIPDGWQGIGRDVTQIRRLQDELAALALRDPLTGLANRRLLDILLEAALARAKRTAAPLAVSLVDLDDFKAVNDVHGHAAGDAVLKEMGRRLAGTVRGADLVARLGGDEFVAMHETVDHGTQTIVDRITEALSPPYELPSGATVTCLPSVGIADSSHHGTVAELIGAADAAMYEAKRAHRGSRRSSAAAPEADEGQDLPRD